MEVTLGWEAPIQEDTPDRTLQATQVLAILPTSTQVETIQLVIPTRTLLEATQQGAIRTKIQLEEDTLTRTLLEGIQQGAIPTKIQLEDTLTRTPLQEAIRMGDIQTRTLPLEVTQLEGTLISFQLLEIIPAESIQEGIHTRTLLEATLLEATLLEDFLIKGPLTSTQEQVVTLSEPEILGRAGVSQVLIQATIPVEGLVDIPTGTRTIRSSVPAMVEEVMFPAWQGLLSLSLCSVWVTSPRPQVLPKKP